MSCKKLQWTVRVYTVLQLQLKFKSLANWGFQPIPGLNFFVGLEIGWMAFQEEEWNNWVDFGVLKDAKLYLFSWTSHVAAGFEPCQPWKKASKSWNAKPTKKGELKHGTGTYKSSCWKDSRMFRSCIVIMVRFVIEIFFVLMNQWSLDDFYVYIRIGTCVLENLYTCFDHHLFPVVNENMALHLVSKEERRLPIRQQVQIVKHLHHWQFWHGEWLLLLNFSSVSWRENLQVNHEPVCFPDWA